MIYFYYCKLSVIKDKKYFQYYRVVDINVSLTDEIGEIDWQQLDKNGQQLIQQASIC